MKKTALLLATIVSFYACGDKLAGTEESIDTDIVDNPATADNEEGIDENAAVPEFAFEKDVHDFGTIVQGEKVAYSFKFKNTGEGDLIITSAKGSCGCTVPEYPVEPIAPGAEGVIDVVFNSDGKSGQQNKKVTIVANTVPNTTVLAINGMVEVPVAE
ncbi:MAG: DUF1573 domain-containing protein [Flavobacteriales bacterium]|nr:DUF1573 domain-containing protein [Flavobacteriales bacterium]